MKKKISIIFILIFWTNCYSQSKTNDYSKIIKEQAEIMAKFLLEKDFSSFTKYTYPKIVEMLGGKQKMVDILNKNSKEMLSQGTDFNNVTIGEPSRIFTNGKELQCTIPQTIEMKVPNGRLITNSTLIAISTDNGKNWYFVDTSGKNIQTMKKTLPNLSEDLVIPEKKQPIFHVD